MFCQLYFNHILIFCPVDAAAREADEVCQVLGKCTSTYKSFMNGFVSSPPFRVSFVIMHGSLEIVKLVYIIFWSLLFYPFLYDWHSHSVPKGSGFNTLFCLGTTTTLGPNHWIRNCQLRVLLWMMNICLKKEGANDGVQHSEEWGTPMFFLCNMFNLLLCFVWNICRLPP